MCRTASPPRARGSTSCVRRRGARSCAEIRQCRAAATPDRFGFHLAQAVGVALQRSWPQVRIVVPNLHPQQKSWSLPAQMRTGASTENLTSLAAMLMSFQPFIFSAVHLHPEERPSAASRSIRPLKLWAAVNPRSAPAPWPAYRYYGGERRTDMGVASIIP